MNCLLDDAQQRADDDDDDRQSNPGAADDLYAPRRANHACFYCLDDDLNADSRG